MNIPPQSCSLYPEEKRAAFLIGMHGILITIYLPSSNDRLMSSELFSVLSRRTSLYSKESASVIADNLFADMRRYILHLLFDYLLRVGPGACGVGIIGTKHHLIGVEYAAHHLYAERIVNEADPNLAVEVIARQHLRKGYWAIASKSAAVSRSLVPYVESLNHARYPNEAGLGHHDLETRMAIKDAREDEASDG